MAAPNPDLWARTRGLTLRQSLNRLAAPTQPVPPPPAATTPRGASELGRLPVVLEPEPSDLGARSERRSPMWIPLEPPPS